MCVCVCVAGIGDNDKDGYTGHHINHLLAEVEWLLVVSKETIKYNLSNHVDTFGTDESWIECSAREDVIKSLICIEYIYICADKK